MSEQPTEGPDEVLASPSVTNPDAESVDDAEHDEPGEGAAAD